MRGTFGCRGSTSNGSPSAATGAVGGGQGPDRPAEGAGPAGEHDGSIAVVGVPEDRGELFEAGPRSGVEGKQAKELTSRLGLELSAVKVEGAGAFESGPTGPVRQVRLMRP